MTCRPVPVFINKVLLEHGHLICFLVSTAIFCTVTAELRSCNRDRWAYKAYTISWPFTEKVCWLLTWSTSTVVLLQAGPPRKLSLKGIRCFKISLEITCSAQACCLAPIRRPMVLQVLWPSTSLCKLSSLYKIHPPIPNDKTATSFKADFKCWPPSWNLSNISPWL